MIQKNPELLAKLPLLVYGLGKSGSSVHRLLKKLTLVENKDFFLYDDHSSNSDLSKIKEIKFKSVVLSPGIDPQKIKEKNIHYLEIISEIDLAGLFLNAEKTLAISGTTGKSTVATMVYQLIQSSGKRVELLGNIGKTLCDYVVEGNKADFIVFELSSFQLDLLKLKFDFGVLSNFYPDHLSRYKDLSDYYYSKLKLFSLVKNEVYVPRNAGSFHEFISQENLKYNQLRVVENKSSFSPLMPHDRVNASVSSEVVESMGVSVDSDLLNEFQSLEHRLKILEMSKNLVLCNDSKSTTIQNVMIALKAFEFYSCDEKILLIGGRSKGESWSSLKEVNGFKIVAFGEMSSEIQAELRVDAAFPTLREALAALDLPSNKKTLLLLSPGGSSYDEFKNYEERGDFFFKFFTN